MSTERELNDALRQYCERNHLQNFTANEKESFVSGWDAALERAAQIATECEDEHFGGAQVEVNNRCGQAIAGAIRQLKGSR